MSLGRQPETPHLILGGARSGKSSYAEALAVAYPAPHIYVATSRVLDEEMAARVRAHRERRADSWKTLECPLELANTLAGLRGQEQAVLVDCLTLWLTNLLLSTPAQAPEEAVSDLVEGIRAVDYPLFLVSNEVGCGIVPDNALARRFRDLAGFANQAVAAACPAVTLMVAGLPLRLK